MRFIVLAVLATGCIPPKQRDVTGGQLYDSFEYVDHLHCGLLQIGPSNVPKSVSIVDPESYAIAPNGKRYGILTTPDPDDLKTEGPAGRYVYDRVYLIDSRGRRINREWANGRWRFVFAIRTPNGPERREFDVRFWTFNYNPLVHGPPN